MGSSQHAVVACATLVAVFMTGVSAYNHTVPLGGRCSITANCSTNYSECIFNSCSCPSDRVPNVNGSTCLLRTTTVNGSCTENSQCSHLANTACIVGRCSCLNGYIYYYGSCYHPSSIPSAPVNPPGPTAPTAAPVPCSSNNDCRYIRNSECRNGWCDCKRGYRPNGNHCSSGTAIRSVLAAVVLSLLFSKIAA